MQTFKYNINPWLKQTVYILYVTSLLGTVHTASRQWFIMQTWSITKRNECIIYALHFKNKRSSASFKSLLHRISHDATEQNQLLLWVLHTCLFPGKPTVLGAYVSSTHTVQEVKEQEADSVIERNTVRFCSIICMVNTIKCTENKSPWLQNIFFLFSFNACARGWHYITLENIFYHCQIEK